MHTSEIRDAGQTQNAERLPFDTATAAMQAKHPPAYFPYLQPYPYRATDIHRTDRQELLDD